MFPTVTGITRNVTSASTLQSTLEESQPGDEIVISANVTFTGSVTLPLRCGTNPAWTIIRTSAMGSLPPLGTRVHPATHASAMPKILADQSSVPALKTRQATSSTCVAQKFWIVGLEISVIPGIAVTGNLVEIGYMTPGGSGEPDPARMARNIYVDRCFIHGAPSQGPNGKETVHGVRLEGRSMALINSHLSDFQAIGNRQGQGLLVSDGVGPFQITNNYIEGSGQNVLFGGQDPASCSGPAGCQIPSDITFTRNTVHKPLYWKKNHPSYVAGTPNWCAGLLFELKNAQRVLVDGNDFQYSWWSGCNGMMSAFAVLLTPRNQDGNDHAATVRDVQFTNNYLAHITGGFSLLGRDDENPSQIQERILIANNIVEDLSPDWNDGSGTAEGRLFQFLTPGSQYTDGQRAPKDVTIDHNTFVNIDPDNNSYLYAWGDPALRRMPGFTFTNNIVWEGVYGVMGGDAARAATQGNASTFNTYFDSSLVFTNNVIVGGIESNYTASGGYPGNVSANRFPASAAAIGFRNMGGGDFCIPSGAYKGAGVHYPTYDAHRGIDSNCPDDDPPPPDGLPSGWSNADIGSTGAAGSASFASGTFSVNGAGAGIAGTSDSFHFVYKSLAGDGELIARVATFTNTTSSDAKAGIMVRSTLSPGSVHIAAVLTPDGAMEVHARETTGGATSVVGGTPRSVPGWVKLVRSGGLVMMYNSADGVNWTGNGTLAFPTGAAYIGLVVASHNTSQVATATFDNVSGTGGGSGLPAGWSTDDVGTTGQTGSAQHASGTFTVNGAGAGIAGTSDSFRFVYKSLAGDGELIARVASFTNTTTSDAKAGIMVRSTLSPGSVHITAALTPDGAMEVHARETTGGATSFVGGTPRSVPGWVKLVRSGGLVKMYNSADGVNWTANGTLAFPTGAAYIGLVVSSHNTSQLATAVFDNIQ
jgi:hypothetical protein